jgi:energy-coupling factor transporter ATP-binding protein EcfA2
MAGFQNVRIRRFKNILDTSFDLHALNVIVGSNNSGKSSILQALHFAIGSIQSLNLNGDLGGEGIGSSTFNPNQLIYVPSEDANSLGLGGRLYEPADQAVQIEFTLDNGEALGISVRKGRNRNIVLGVSSKAIARSIGSLENPFTIFTPGLAGIAKTEQYVSDGVLLRTIARGDANLVLRNTLLRLWNDRRRTTHWQDFLNDLHIMFPNISLQIAFAQATDEYIRVNINDGQALIPLELTGTGILQALQILSYIHFYHPQVIVLDEPDSHLHPNNQRLLCALLRDVAESRNVQVILSTHSRHVLDTLRHSAVFLWTRDGAIEVKRDGTDLSILLDLGALDIKERIAAGAGRCLILTEDDRTDPLKAALASSGFDLAQTEVISYRGSTLAHNLRPLIEAIREVRADIPIVIHMDRDYHTDEEIEQWRVKIRALRLTPFVTYGVDIESHFLSDKHLSELNAITVEQAQDLINRAVDTCREESIRKFVNSRVEIEKKKGNFGDIDLGQLGIDVQRTFDGDPLRYSHGKTVLARVRAFFRDENGHNLVVTMPTVNLAAPDLEVIARRIFPAAG